MLSIQHHHFVSIDSTNNWAKENAHTFSPDALTVVTADEQTAGRGRFNRKWISPAGDNLYLTFCFSTSFSPILIGNIPQVLAVSVASVLKKLGFELQLKWPNDILLLKKKIAGILCETISLENSLWVILGIGINVNMPSDQLKLIDLPATSLLAESGKSFSIQEIQASLIAEFNQNLEKFRKEGYSPFYSEFAKRFNLKKGDPITLLNGNKQQTGTFEALNPDGSILIQLENGKIDSFHSGELAWNQEDLAKSL